MGKGSNERRIEWDDIRMTLGQENRFCNTSALRELDYIFFGEDEDFKINYQSPVVVRVGPGSTNFNMYRARYFGSLEDLKKAMVLPDMELVRPPSRLAKAGRVNAHGVSVLYGANGKKVALSEVRPPVGSYAIIVRFRVVSEIRLLDVEELRKTFAEKFSSNNNMIQRGKFIGCFGDQISRPIMPEDASTEYVITQVISDFLASNERHKIDGLIYGSAQRRDEKRIQEEEKYYDSENGKNIVLFHKSSISRSFNDSDIDRLYNKIRADYSNYFGQDDMSKIRKSNLKSYTCNDRKGLDDEKVELDIESISVYRVTTANFDTCPEIE